MIHIWITPIVEEMIYKLWQAHQEITFLRFAHEILKNGGDGTDPPWRGAEETGPEGMSALKDGSQFETFWILVCII